MAKLIPAALNMAFMLIRMIFSNTLFNIDGAIPDKLIELTGLKNAVSEDQYDLIDELIPLNIQARYPA